MSLESSIPGCFGAADKKFAAHPADIKRAKEMLVMAFNEGITSWSEYEYPIKKYLKQEKCSDVHIETQMKRIKDLSNYFTCD